MAIGSLVQRSALWFASRPQPGSAASRVSRSRSASAVVYAAVFLPPLALIAAVLAQPWFEPRWAFMDPLIAGKMSGDCCRIYYGAVSNIGVLYWATAAAISLFATAVAFRAGSRDTAIMFPLAGGAFTALLCLDDLFMLHEGFFPMLGVPQNAVLATYALAGLAYLAFFQREIIASDVALFAIGVAFLAVSVGIDVVFHSTDNRLVWMEDAAKLLGIAGWTGFHVLRAFRLLTGEKELRPSDNVEAAPATPIREAMRGRIFFANRR